ncbi:hypothetical protein PMAYCL1PPCAC_32997, partial [Pristionchus mayeri]
HSKLSHVFSTRPVEMCQFCRDCGMKIVLECVKFTGYPCSQRMRSQQHVLAAIAVVVSLFILHSLFKGWSANVPATMLTSHSNQTRDATDEGIASANITTTTFKPYPLGHPYYVFPTARNNTSFAVTIVIVITEGTNKDNYAKAINTVQCYGALHGYTVSVEFDNKFEECAVHKDKFFRRHCHTHKLMKTEIKEGEWALFIDGDVGVVNPKRLIEEYFEDGYEIYLFDRFYNYEYAALSFLVKNNERGRGWVDEFAGFEFKLPNSFHGTD